MATERIDIPTRGNLGQALAELYRRAPGTTVTLLEHDDECPAIGTAVGCTCEVVIAHVEGNVPPEVAW